MAPDPDGRSNISAHIHSSKYMLYEAIFILSIDHENKFHIMKDRNRGVTGEISTDIAIDKMADMLTRAVFDGSMEMFQETMKMKIVESIRDVIFGNNIIPKGDIEDANTIQCEGGRDGIRHNSLLQRFISLRR